jgi:hypothetical protein
MGSQNPLVHPSSQTARHEQRCIPGKGLANHVKRQQPEKVSHQRHQDARHPDREGFDGKKDDGHGNNSQYDHRFSGSLLGVRGDLPLNHLFDIPVFSHHLDKRLGRRQNKGDQDEKASADSDPQSFLTEDSGFFPMRVHQIAPS